MYSDELFKYLYERMCMVSPDEYNHICSTCPQINSIKYDAFSDNFDIWTNDNYHFKFKIKKE